MRQASERAGENCLANPRSSLQSSMGAKSFERGRLEGEAVVVYGDWGCRLRESSPQLGHEARAWPT